ncbi:amino acid permease-associated region [Xylanimonas cellulosilytica DSM 15894]|uniref:Amino acid permease-associated region n=1 Tax=Xylanimonas cellulosilytica (strain DSM 15894 / JCM 12276 / CECT 5975 / KCTC 9989 / LMG 20990 / NBRC 107835 / XIL07) TaxID=446471 RepID=D1BZU1_XYLCX|nr:APC family permease [Xylanimonas cellulosilytica]ACZ32069.1 amino acid permease-associated region [Xylanimonas cellulosilytica DSM 15894]
MSAPTQTTGAPPDVTPSGTVGARALTGKLGPVAIVFMVVAAAAPLTVVGGAAPLGILLGNGVGFPALYALSGVILLCFSVGLAAMTREVPRPGAFFSFVGYGLGRRPGLAAAYLALLTYTTIQVSVYGYVGFILSGTMASLGLPVLPWWLWALVVAAVVGVLGYRHIDLSSKVLGVLLVGEVGIVLAVVAGVLVTGGAEGLSAAPFEPSTVMSGSPAIGLMFAIAAFIGFEATAIFRDEARDPERTIPRATYGAVIGIAIFYTLASWGLVMAWGPGHVVDVAAADPGAMIVTTTAKYLGTAGEVVVQVLLVTSMLACVLSFHNVITRYQHTMSNAGLLPSGVGAVHAKHLSPYASSLVQTATSVLLVGLFAVLGLDPVLQVFTWFAGVATLAIAILMAVTSLAVIVWFRRSRGRTRRWNTLVAPALGLLGLAVAAVAIVANFPLLVGDVDASGAQRFGLVSAVLLAVVVLCPLVGWVQATALRRRRPQTYARITDAIG